MSHYDYKVVPAPKRAKKVKGVRTAEELFALTLTEAINEVARQGWEYVRAEHLPAEASRGWFRSALSGEQTVLVFRREREGLGPRLATARPDARPEPRPEPRPDAAPEARVPEPPAPAADRSPGERAVIDRMRRREPSVRLEPVAGPEAPTPLRPAPRLGPADES